MNANLVHVAATLQSAINTAVGRNAVDCVVTDKNVVVRLLETENVSRTAECIWHVIKNYEKETNGFAPVTLEPKQ